MTSPSTDTGYTAFAGDKLIATGSLKDIVSELKDVIGDDRLSNLLIFDDATGKVVDVDLCGTKEDVLKRLQQRGESGGGSHSADTQKPRPVGRPKLGVVPGEVTLLPRHWDWLKSQPGGASVTLRKLVDEARRVRSHEDVMRQAQEATYRFMTTMAGNFPHYEDALRALYAQDLTGFYHVVDSWKVDVRDHIKKLAKNAFADDAAE